MKLKKKMIGDDTDDDLPLLVFHYDMNLSTVEELFYSRGIKLS
jgi:hypothetical protein